MADDDVCMRDLKGVRKEILFNALNETQILQENVSFNTVIDLDNIINTAEVVNEQLSLTEKVENQDEIVLDSEVMKSSSIVIKECTNSLTKNFNTYNLNEYAQFILEYIGNCDETVDGNEVIPWNSFESEITFLFKKTPFWSTLGGALKPLPKKPVKQRASTLEKKAPLSQIKKPETVDKTETEAGSEEASLAVQKIKKIIDNYYRTNQIPLDYFCLVLHPTDFGKTIENILHVAFLVRDGYISLHTAENGALTVIPCSKEMIKQAKSSEKKGCVQNIISMNSNQWKILKNHYNIKEPMIRF